MNTFGLGLLLFLAGGVAHVLLWWVRPPADSGRVLTQVFLVTILALLGGAVAAAAHSPEAAALLPQSPVGWVHAALLAFSLTGGYVMTYPAIEVESPTLVMIAAIARKGEEGLPKDQFMEELNDEVLVLPRIQDLLDERMAVLVEDRYVPTAKGRFIARVFTLWRGLLGAPKGG